MNVTFRVTVNLVIDVTWYQGTSFQMWIRISSYNCSFWSSIAVRAWLCHKIKVSTEQ